MNQSSIPLRSLILFLSLACCLSLSAYEIETVAGTGEPGPGMASGEASRIAIGYPFGVEIGPDKALYITEVMHHRVRRLDLDTKTITTVAGCGRQGYSGDGGPAIEAELNEPYEVRFDADGNMFFVEMKNHLIRRVDAKTSTISTVAGTGQAGFSGDGGPATRATFQQPHSLVLDGRGGLYIADIGNHRIRKVDLATGVVTTFAGTGEKKLPIDGQEAEGHPLLGPRALFYQHNTLWVALREGHSVWQMNLNDKKWRHVAGTGAMGYSGDGASAKLATFNGPKGIAADGAGNLFVADTENEVIRRIDAGSATITTIAGRGPKFADYGGDGGPAREAKLKRPHGIYVAENGIVYIGDTENHRVRALTP